MIYIIFRLTHGPCQAAIGSMCGPMVPELAVCKSPNPNFFAAKEKGIAAFV